MTAYFITMIVLHLARVFLAMGGDSKPTERAPRPATVRMVNIIIYSGLAAWGFMLLLEHVQAVAP